MTNLINISLTWQSEQINILKELPKSDYLRFSFDKFVIRI